MTIPYQAALFDLDGTLLYTLEDLADSLNFVLAEEGLPTHAPDEYRFMVGNGLEKLVVRSLPEGLRIPAHVRPIFQKFLERYRANQCVKTRPYPGVPEMLAGLQGRGVRLAVLSNKAHPNTLTVVEHYFPQKPFQVVLGLRPEVPAKPDPAGALEIARALGLAPEACVYLGDSDVDMLTAKNAGFASCGVLWGFRPKQELAAAGAQVFAATPGELEAVILGNLP